MSEKPQPSHVTMFVAEAMTSRAFYALAFNLVMYLTDEVDHPGETRKDVAIRLLTQMVENPLDPDIAGVPRDQFDADEAQSIALESIGDAIQAIRKGLLA